MAHTLGTYQFHHNEYFIVVSRETSTTMASMPTTLTVMESFHLSLTIYSTNDFWPYEGKIQVKPIRSEPLPVSRLKNILETLANPVHGTSVPMPVLSVTPSTSGSYFTVCIDSLVFQCEKLTAESWFEIGRRHLRIASEKKKTTNVPTIVGKIETVPNPGNGLLLQPNKRRRIATGNIIFPTAKPKKVGAVEFV